MAAHLEEVKAKKGHADDHHIRVSFNPRTQEFGALCVGGSCNVMVRIRAEDVPDEWRHKLGMTSLGGAERVDVQAFLNVLDRPDEEILNLYEVHQVMES